MANSEDLEQLMSITGADRNLAENLLEACGGELSSPSTCWLNFILPLTVPGNLEMAVNMHMEDAGGGAGPANHQVAPAPGGASLVINIF